MKTILVMGLSSTVTQFELLRLFQEHGSVLGVDLAEGQEFGFVRMADNAEAKTAIDTLNGTLCSGVRLSISAAGTKRPRAMEGNQAVGAREVVSG